jgi:hypothetical protein
MPIQRDDAVQKIFATRGLASRIARQLGVTAQAVGQWTRVPPEYVVDLMDLLEMRPAQIRPDVFTYPDGTEWTP